jgi:hypothetical protein
MRRAASDERPGSNGDEGSDPAAFIARLEETGRLILPPEPDAELADDRRACEPTRSPIRDAIKSAEGRNGRPTDGEPRADRMRFITSAELAASNLVIEYLVDGVIVKGQPCVIAGGKKVLKTNLSIDLVLSLGNGFPFAGKFRVTKPVKVAMLSGESGRATIAETALRIAKTKKWGLEHFENVIWSFDLPRLGERRDLEELDRHIKNEGLAAAVIDPTYLALPLGDSAKNLFEVGAKLVEVNHVFEENYCTPILNHHCRKNAVSPFDPPELEDIAWAGFQEWARQWILIGRRKRYDPENGGHHELWLNIGGSAGHSSLWGVNLDEGTRDDVGGRRWEIEVIKPSAARADAAASRDEEHERQAQQARAEVEARIIKVLSSRPDGETKSAIADSVRRNRKYAKEVLDKLLDDGRVEPCEFKKNKRTERGFRLAD